MIDKIYTDTLKNTHDNSDSIGATYFMSNDGFNRNMITHDIVSALSGGIISGQVFPLTLDNRQKLSPVDNQGNHPACVAFSVCSVAESYFWKRNGFPCNYDALKLYKKCKSSDNMPNTDGTRIDVALKCALDLGIFGRFSVLPESKICTQQVKTVFNHAKFPKSNDTAKDKNHLDRELIHTIKSILMKYDFMVAGFAITEDYYKCNSKKYIISNYDSKKFVGHHAMTICGWIDKEGFILQNQWGTNFGAKGFCIISYEAFLKSFVYGGYITNIYNELD